MLDLIWHCRDVCWVNWREKEKTRNNKHDEKSCARWHFDCSETSVWQWPRYTSGTSARTPCGYLTSTHRQTHRQIHRHREIHHRQHQRHQCQNSTWILDFYTQGDTQTQRHTDRHHRQYQRHQCQNFMWILHFYTQTNTHTDTQTHTTDSTVAPVPELHVDTWLLHTDRHTDRHTHTHIHTDRYRQTHADSTTSSSNRTPSGY